MVNLKESIVPVPKKARKSEVKKEIIPKAFIDHVVTLGFQENDANVLYDNKDDWIGISTGKLMFDFSVQFSKCRAISIISTRFKKVK